MKSLLLYVQDDSGFETRFQAALDIARATGGHLECVYASPVSSFLGAAPLGDAFSAPAIMQMLADQEGQVRARISSRLAREDVPWDFVTADGTVGEALISHSALADLVVLSHPSGGESRGVVNRLIADVVMGAHTPVLVLPEDMKGFNLAANAAIAWNGTFECANALKAAVPLLRRAGSVSIITIDERDQGRFPASAAGQYLSRHGIECEIYSHQPGGRWIEDALLDAARIRDAAYMVLGGYSHHRLREYWLGGVTQSMIEHAPIPVLFAR